MINASSALNPILAAIFLSLFDVSQDFNLHFSLQITLFRPGGRDAAPHHELLVSGHGATRGLLPVPQRCVEDLYPAGIASRFCRVFPEKKKKGRNGRV